MFDEIELNFLIAGHTNNKCDGALGCIKKQIRRSDVRFPKEMKELVNNSYASTVAVSPQEIDWFLWKNILGQMFYVPSALKINSFHQFKLSKHDVDGKNCRPGVLFAREASTVRIWNRFYLRKRERTINPVSFEMPEELLTSYRANIPRLPEVRISKDLTRRQYLVRNVHQRYYEHDESFEGEYFGQ